MEHCSYPRQQRTVLQSSSATQQIFFALMIHSNVDFLFAGTVETFRFVTGCIDYFSGFEGFGSLILFCAFVTLFISTVCSSGQRWVELFIKVACLSTIYVNVICSLFAQVYELFSSSCLKKGLTLKVLILYSKAKCCQFQEMLLSDAESGQT